MTVISKRQLHGHNDPYCARIAPWWTPEARNGELCDTCRDECFRCGDAGVIAIGKDYLCEECYESAPAGDFA